MAMFTEDQDYEFNSRFDYVSEAYGNEAQLIRQMDASDRQYEADEAAARWAAMSAAERFSVVAGFERSCVAFRPVVAPVAVGELPF